MLCLKLFPGVLVDITENYSSAFYSCAVGMGLGALFLGLVRPAKTGFPCAKKIPSPSLDIPVVEQESEDKVMPEEFLEVDVLPNSQSQS